MSTIDISQFPDTVAEFDMSPQRAKVFLDRYARKDPETGEPVESSPDEMWGRVARGIGVTDAEQRAFYALMQDFKFVPGGRILAGAGTGTEVTFYNCYVIPVETKNRRRVREAMAETGEPIENWDTDEDTGSDSREAIIDTIGLMVDIMSRGGGVGVNWSVLRPNGAHLKSINATSSGPLDWMHFASVAVGTVEQGGSRRGAAMFMLDDWHPNVIDFIDAKRDLSRITNANISVSVSDEFMRRVAEDKVWNFMFPDTSHPAYDTEWDGDLPKWLERHGGESVKFHGSIRARDLWRKLAEAAWDNGEPGVVFLDRYNKQSTAAGVERIIAVNPCGEQGLGPYSVCNLGAMNLAPYTFEDGTFDWGEFRTDVGTAVAFLDRVIDANFYFLDENERVQKDLRRIGLSVMGLADALVYLGLRYGSPEAVAFTEQVFMTMKDAAIEASIELAMDLGPAPAWDESMVERPYLAEHIARDASAEERLREHGLRNLFLLTQAPTGTTSILAGVNSGIEPFFALGYWREDRTGKHWVEPAAVREFKASEKADIREPGLDYSVLVTANDVTVEEHVAMQAAVQKYVDSSVSKTINAPNSHTIDDVEKAYTMAYESGLKGLAYFRDGCGRAQVLSTESTEKKGPPAENPGWSEELLATYKWLYEDTLGVLEDVKADAEPILALHRPYLRPDALTGRTHKVRAGQTTAYVTVNREVAAGVDKPVEVLVNAGKAGTDLMAMGEALGRLASVGLQKGLTLDDIVDQLEGVGNDGMLNRSLPSAIAFALKADVAAEAEAAAKFNTFITGTADIVRNLTMETPDGTYEGQFSHIQFTPREAALEFEAEFKGDFTEPSPSGDLCPDCGGLTLIREEGCKKCHSCGYSAC